MKNFSIKDPKTGKEWWISRAMCVVGIVTAVDPENPREKYYLVSKRGPGSPDHVGKWQCTCGYLDYDETLKDAMIRELYEETGLDLKRLVNSSDIKLLEIVDDPERDARQNVSFRYLITVPYEVLKDKLDCGEINCDTVSRGGEKGEIDEIRLVHEKDVDAYDWAFNHKEIIKTLKK